MTHPLTPREKVAAVVLDAAASYLIQQYGASHGLDHEVDRARIMSAIPNDAILTALASGSGDHAELARGKACGDRMIATADALMPWLKNYPPSTRRERAIEAANAAAAASCGPLLAEIAALRADRDAKDLEIGRVIFRATEAERKLAEAVGHISWMRNFVPTVWASTEERLNEIDAFLSKEAERG